MMPDTKRKFFKLSVRISARSAVHIAHTAIIVDFILLQPVPHTVRILPCPAVTHRKISVKEGLLLRGCLGIVPHKERLPLIPVEQLIVLFHILIRQNGAAQL